MSEQKKKQEGQDNANSERDAYNRKMIIWIIALLVLFAIAWGILITVMGHRGMANFLQN
ncbi:MAG: hypothetical protein V4557_08260 [Bacteroidota bacterium]